MIYVEKAEGEELKEKLELVEGLLKNSKSCVICPEYRRMFSEVRERCKILWVVSEKGKFQGAAGLEEDGRAGFFIPETEEACIALARELENKVRETGSMPYLQLPVLSRWYLALERKGFHLKKLPGDETFLVLEKRIPIRKKRERKEQISVSKKTLGISIGIIFLLILVSLFLGEFFQQIMGSVSGA